MFNDIAKVYGGGMINESTQIKKNLKQLVNDKLRTIADKIADNKLELNKIDADLVAIKKQLIILNKLKFLESVDVNIMSEDEKKSAYGAIQAELFDFLASN